MAIHQLVVLCWWPLSDVILLPRLVKCLNENGLTFASVVQFCSKAETEQTE